MRKILIAILAASSVLSCFSERDASDIILFVTPASDTTARSGDRILYEIETWTIHESLASVEIWSFDTENASTLLFSKDDLTDRYEGRFVYEVPEISRDEAKILLEFIVNDSEGHSRTRKIQVTIENDEELLKEMTSITMFSAFSGKADAFSMKDFKTVSSSVAEESALDIYMYAEPEADAEKFRPEWRSRTGLMFARANNMDYSAVTKSALNVIYNNSIKSENVPAITNDDIIIIGRENTALGVFKIILVQDSPGSSEDRMLFSFKPA